MYLVLNFKHRLSGVRSQRGDTIVEVMMALAVLGLAMSIAYAVASHSLVDVHESEQHAATTEYAQGQIEDINDLSAQPDSSLYNESSSFCFPSSSTTPTPTPYSATVPAPGGDSNCLFGPNNLYTIKVVSCDGDPSNTLCMEAGATAPGNDTFVVNVTWPGPSNIPVDSTTLTYRVHPS